MPSEYYTTFIPCISSTPKEDLIPIGNGDTQQEKGRDLLPTSRIVLCISQTLENKSMLYILSLICFMLFVLPNAQAQSPSNREAAEGQHRILIGEVRSNVDNKPIEGVSLRVGEIRSNTNKNGKFWIAPTQQRGTLEFTHIGFRKQTIKYNTQTAYLTIVLEPLENQIEGVEVVSTGYQQIPKERATGSFEFVDSALFNRKVSSDLISRLEDVVPSLSSIKFFESNRGEIPNINIRGMSTMRSQRWPLIVLDGMPYEGHFNNINPNDIENITILKDAASSSIWGAQSGNGVLVITTKRGKYGEPFRLSVNVAGTVANKPDLFYQRQMSASDYIDVELLLADQGYYDSRMYDIWTEISPVVQLLKKEKDGLLSQEEMRRQIDELRDNDVRRDYLKYIYRPSLLQQYNMQLSGGSEKLSTVFSVGYDHNKDHLVTNSNDRISLRNATTFRPIKDLEIDLSVQYTETRKKEPHHAVGYSVTAGYPYMQLADADGNPLVAGLIGMHPEFRDTVAGGRLLDWQYRPLAELDATSQQLTRRETVVSVGAGYMLLPGLKASVLYNYRSTNGVNDVWRGMESAHLRAEINYYANWNNQQVNWGMPLGDFQHLFNQQGTSHQGRWQLTYDGHFADKHRISALAGSEIRNVAYDVHSTVFMGVDRETLAYTPVDMDREFPYLNGMLGRRRLPDYRQYTATLDRYVSHFANASYTFLDRYILSGSLRKDASNLFGVRTNDKGQPFWSVGGAWIVSKETFAPDWLDQLKLRTTYGYNGNVNNSVAAYPIIAIQSQVNSITGERYARIQSPPNPNLRWENVGMWNLGLDFSLKGNRLSGSVEYYHKMPKDLIAATRIDPSTGFATLNINSANLEGKGVDLSLHSVNISKPSFQWTSDLVFAYNRTKVAKSFVSNTLGLNFVGGAHGMLMTPIEGMDLHSIYAFKWAGLDPETGMPRGYVDGEISDDYAAIYNRTDVTDMDNHGSALPRYFGSLRNAFRYKSWELSFNIAYQLGHKFMRSSVNYTRLVSDGIGHSDFADRWQQPGDEQFTDVPVFGYPPNYYGDAFYNFSSALVERADQVKLRDVRLDYRLPSTKMFKNAGLYVYMYNVATLWRANKIGLDPEYGSSSPDPLSVSVGLNVSL
ncbi:SusC/RagA family TonB-linked outer membrane protein [Sphingobacterium corticibacterium]|nr:SusC/RagA family TonB-linked outer membrane protein [Sphingobacterium corticibacterium]